MPARASRTTSPTPAPTAAPALVPALAHGVADSPAAAPSAAAPPGQPAGDRGLKVWQRAMDLAASVYRVTKGMTDEALAGELWRAALAVPAHIATGNSLYVRASYVEHLSAAHGQIARLECLVHLGDRLGAVPGTDAAALLASAADVGRMLRGLARALQPKGAGEAAETVH
jgi:four helix bundle protein